MGSYGNKLVLLTILRLVQWISGGCALETTESNNAPVRFEINLTWEDYEVAGINRKTILSNGEFPGPVLQLQQGDDVEFVVNNQLPFSTSVHFHGIEQQGTPWSDGVPGLSQRPIESGDYFVYRWTATQYGSYLYHAHRRGQIEDGMFGPIYIHPSHETKRPFDKISDDPFDRVLMHEAEKSTQPIMLSDWHALTSEEVWQAEKDSGYDAYCVNALLVNGKGSVQCLSEETLRATTTEAMKMLMKGHKLTDIGCLYPADTVQGNFVHNYSALPETVFDGCTPTKGEMEIFRVDPEVHWVSWDLISSAGVSSPEFSIDEHPMWVYAVDGRYIEPMEVHSVRITNGARYSVLVKLDKPAGDYTIRVPNNGINQILNATAILSYDIPHKIQTRPSEPYIDIVGGNTTADTIILDESKVVPFPAITPSNDIDRTFKLIIDHHDHQSYRWIMGNSSFDMDYEDSTPLLFNRTSIPTDLTVSTRNGTWVDIIIEARNPVQPPHPIHKHSNKYFVIGQGSGSFNYSSVAEAMEHIPESFNLRTPQIRDTFITPPVQTEPTWLALRYQVVNPGPFLMHCHVQVHLSGGMAIALLDGVDKWPTVPEGYELPAVEDD